MGARREIAAGLLSARASRAAWGSIRIIFPPRPSHPGVADVQLSAITVYPIKSAAGIPLDRAAVDDFGLRHDRRWMLVDGAGRFLTQRVLPRLALIRVALTDEALEVTAPGMPPLEVPFEPVRPVARQVEVWRDRCEALGYDGGVSRWFAEFLGVECGLVYFPADGARPADPAHAPPGTRVGFADGFPFLLISQASLDDLNARLDARHQPPVPMNRFRPNLVIDGCAPFAEDGWREIRVGGIRFTLVKPCARCSIPAVDQATGERGTEPTRTLATYRRRDGKVWFGQNLVHHDRGMLRVGDAVSVGRLAD